MNVFTTDIAGAGLSLAHDLPFGKVLRDLFPESRGQHPLCLEIKVAIQSGGQRRGRAEYGAQREELPGTRRKRALFHLHDVPEERGPEGDHASELGPVVPVVVQDADGARGAYRVSVEIGEHLLTACQTD